MELWMRTTRAAIARINIRANVRRTALSSQNRTRKANHMQNHVEHQTNPVISSHYHHPQLGGIYLTGYASAHERTIFIFIHETYFLSRIHERLRHAIATPAHNRIHKYVQPIKCMWRLWWWFQQLLLHIRTSSTMFATVAHHTAAHYSLTGSFVAFSCSPQIPESTENVYWIRKSH